MYKDDVKDLKSQKRESNAKILYDFFSIYIRMKLFLPDLEVERLNLVKMVQMYFDCDSNETIVLKEIKRLYGSLDEHEGVDELLDDFDDMFDSIYKYCQDAFGDYETFLSEYGDFVALIYHRIKMIIRGNDPDTEALLRYRHWMNIKKVDFPIFDEDYKEKVLIMLPTLPDKGDDFDGEVQFQVWCDELW